MSFVAEIGCIQVDIWKTIYSCLYIGCIIEKYLSHKWRHHAIIITGKTKVQFVDETKCSWVCEDALSSLQLLQHSRSNNEINLKHLNSWHEMYLPL